MVLFRSIGLDPEDDTLDLTIFRGLERFLEEDLDATERNQFMHRTLPSMVDRALQLKKFRPPSGLHFTLQQQGTCLLHAYLLFVF